MKKLLAFLSAITVCASCFSCAGKNQKNSSDTASLSGDKLSTTDVLTAVKLSDVAYKKKTVDVPSDLHMIFSTMSFNGGENFLILGSGSKSPQFWVTDRDFTDFREVDYPDFDIGMNYNINLLNDGTAVTIVNSVDYGGLPAPDPSAEGYNQEEYDAAASYTLRIYTYSPDGSVATENDVSDFPVVMNKTVSIGSIVSDGRTVLAEINGTYELFDIGGAYIGELTAGDDEKIETVGNDRDGNIIVAVRSGEYAVQFRIVGEDGALQDSELVYNFPETVYYNIVPGSGDYSMFVSSMSTIYGIKAEDGSVSGLFSLNAAGLNSSNFSDFALASDGTFIIPVTKMSDWSVSVKRYTPCDPEELKNIPTLTLGTFYENSLLTETVETMNEENSDFRIEIKYYNDNIQLPQGFDFTDEEAMLEFDKQVKEKHDKAIEEMRNDALEGNLPDIILTDSLTGVFGDVDLADMGALCDLGEFMAKDDTLNRENIVPSVLRAIDETFDGHVYSLPTEFHLRLPNVMKTKFAKDITEWDFDTYIDTLENITEILGNGAEDQHKTKYSREYVMRFEHWIDLDKAECYFDSPEFLRYLEYCNDGEPDPELEPYDPNEEFDEEEARQQFIEQQSSYIEDKKLLSDLYINSYFGYLYDTAGTFGGEDVTVLGEVDGKMDTAVLGFSTECFAITECCENKELAWEFLKYRFSDSYYTKYYVGDYVAAGDFPSTVSAMNIYRQNADAPVDNSYYTGYEDYTGHLYDTGYMDENGNMKFMEIGNVTDEIIAKVDGYIETAVVDPSQNINVGNKGNEQSELYDICEEEFERMVHGEITPEECAYMMQNRASIYLSEQFG